MNNTNNQNIKPETAKEENQHNLPMPDRDTLGAWYGIKWKGVMKRLEKKGVKIIDRILTEKDIGEIFYALGLPPLVPTELYEWAKELKEDYYRLYVKKPLREK